MNRLRLEYRSRIKLRGFYQKIRKMKSSLVAGYFAWKILWLGVSFCKQKWLRIKRMASFKKFRCYFKWIDYSSSGVNKCFSDTGSSKSRDTLWKSRHLNALKQMPVTKASVAAHLGFSFWEVHTFSFTDITLILPSNGYWCNNLGYLVIFSHR